MQNTYVIIGSSAAGISAVGKLRQLDENARIVCISDEQEFPYNKCFLVDYLSQQKQLEQVYTKPQDFFSKNGIELKLGLRVVALDRDNKKVICSDGSAIEYTKLLLGLGGGIVMPPIQGIKDTRGIFPFYNLQDTQALKAWIEQSQVKNVVIIGAGLSGLECADALKGYNVSITLIDRNAHVLGRQTDQAGALFIQKKATDYNVKFYFGTSITRIHAFNQVVSAVELADGTCLDTQMVICALGARPNSQLARAAGLEIEQDAVVTNQWLQTSDPAIYAAGDVALVTNKMTGQKMRNCTWPDALVQGSTAATNMVEHIKPYAGVALITASHFFGLSFHTAGDLAVLSESSAVQQSGTDEYYQKIFTSPEGVVQGFLLIGHTEHLSPLKRSWLTQTPLLDKLS